MEDGAFCFGRALRNLVQIAYHGKSEVVPGPKSAWRKLPDRHPEFAGIVSGGFTPVHTKHSRSFLSSTAFRLGLSRSDAAKLRADEIRSK